MKSEWLKLRLEIRKKKKRFESVHVFQGSTCQLQDTEKMAPNSNAEKNLLLKY